jgi:hypothetical protein
MVVDAKSPSLPPPPPPTAEKEQRNAPEVQGKAGEADQEKEFCRKIKLHITLLAKKQYSSLVGSFRQCQPQFA